MIDDLPKEPTGASGFVSWCRRLLMAVRRRTPLEGDGYSVEVTTKGWRLRFNRDRAHGYKPRWTEMCDENGVKVYAKVMRTKAVSELPEGASLDD